MNLDSWDIVQSFFAQNSLSNHQIESYNTFIEHNIQSIIYNVGNIELKKENTVEGSIEFGKIYNAQGEIIQLIQRNTRQIDIAYFENGIYFLEINVNKVSQVLKFIKL